MSVRPFISLGVWTDGRTASAVCSRTVRGRSIGDSRRNQTRTVGAGKSLKRPGVEPVFPEQSQAINYAAESRVLSRRRDSDSGFERRHRAYNSVQRGRPKERSSVIHKKASLFTETPGQPHGLTNCREICSSEHMRAIIRRVTILLRRNRVVRVVQLEFNLWPKSR